MNTCGRKASVLMVTGIFPPDIGGPATYVPLMATELLSRGHEVMVITSSEPRDMSQTGAYPFTVLRLPRRINKLIRTLLIVGHIIKEGKRFDLLFVNGFHVEAALANLFLRKPCLMKVVGDFVWEAAHGRWTDRSFLEFQKREQGLFLEALKLIRNWSLKRADMVIVPSRFLQETIIGWGIWPQKSRVIYNAVGFTQEGRDKMSKPEDNSGALKVISIGRLIKVKNFDKGIRAVGRLPQVDFTIVGEGPLEDDIRGLIAELGLESRVKLSGKVPYECIPRVLREHDVMLLVSSHEGFPHVVIEAMSEGLVIVATAVGGLREVVRDGENGLLVEPEEQSIYHALRLLLEKPQLRKRLSEAALHDARGKFGVNAMVEETEKAIDDVMGMRKARARRFATGTR